MKTMAVVTMVASLATLALLIFAGGKAQEVQQNAQKSFDEFKANPLKTLFGMVKTS